MLKIIESVVYDLIKTPEGSTSIDCSKNSEKSFSDVA